MPELDDVDHAIIGLLTEDARRTLSDIGERVTLSAPAVKRRIDRLESLGVIAGYTAVVDHAKLGRPLQAFCRAALRRRPRRSPTSPASPPACPRSRPSTRPPATPTRSSSIRVQDVADLTRVIDLLRRSGRVTGTKTLMVLDVWRRGS